MNRDLSESVKWVGYVDWTVRDFHGYETNCGSTYNAYLIKDEKNTIVDTVKAEFSQYFLDSLKAQIDLNEVTYLVCNHAEPDHSGSYPELVKACPNAEVVCNEKCKEILGQHFDISDWKIKVIEDGEELSIGEQTLKFINTPFVHWPESMFTYLKEEEILFSMDAFGQHYASSYRFDDENDLDILMAEAKTYYANIVMPFGVSVKKTLASVSDLPIKTIATSHGIIWRSHINKILQAYTDWADNKTKKKVVILYESMWKSTEKMAREIAFGAEQYDVEVKLLCTKTTHITEIATETLDAAVIAVGSSTLNMTILPGMAKALTYLKGLKPKNRLGFVFGSYGWAPGGTRDVDKYIDELKWEKPFETLNCQYVPTDEILKKCRDAGKALAEKALEK